MKLLDVTKDFWKISIKESTIRLGRHTVKPVSNKPLAMRATKRAYRSVRNRLEDKLASFFEMVKTTFKIAHFELVNNAPEGFVTVYREYSPLYTSHQFLLGMPMFLGV